MNKTISGSLYRRRAGVWSGTLATKPRKQYKHEEDDLTIRVASHLEDLKTAGIVLQFSHISNETYTKYWSIKVKNRAKGVRSGVPDFIIVFRWGILFLELKKEKGGVLSDNQKAWLESIRRSGGLAEVASGWDQSVEIIDKYAQRLSTNTPKITPPLVNDPILPP